jgi:hypothetical protein
MDLIYWILIGSALGIVFRFFVPYLRKVGEGDLELSFKEIEIKYVIEAIIAFLTTIVATYGVIPLIPWTLHGGLWALIAFFVGIGNMEVVNEIVKVANTVKTIRTSG